MEHLTITITKSIAEANESVISYAGIVRTIMITIHPMGNIHVCVQFQKRSAPL